MKYNNIIRLSHVRKTEVRICILENNLMYNYYCHMLGEIFYEVWSFQNKANCFISIITVFLWCDLRILVHILLYNINMLHALLNILELKIFLSKKNVLNSTLVRNVKKVCKRHYIYCKPYSEVLTVVLARKYWLLQALIVVLSHFTPRKENY